MSFAITQSNIASTTMRSTKQDPEPVNQRESTDAPAKREVVDEAQVSARISEKEKVSGDTAIADFATASTAADTLTSRIPAEPGLALGAQARLDPDNSVTLLR
ncbi:MAG: hypothetical protein Q4G30_08640 [Actinomycetaceae bacterium]|nr:hypothetical protein [Actinomycetaceae bacterium]